jgi:hypothetical protein
MESVPQDRRTSSPRPGPKLSNGIGKFSLTAAEREVIVTYNDSAREWHVYSDSATMRERITRLAQQVGATVERVGEGIEFTCPADALRLSAKRRGHPPAPSTLANLRSRQRPGQHRATGGKVALLAGS